MMTGVSPAYRGRGIVLALSLLITRAARRWGVPYIRTNNDSENAPMLAVNRTLGYTPEPGYYRMVSELEQRVSQRVESGTTGHAIDKKTLIEIQWFSYSVNLSYKATEDRRRYEVQRCPSEGDHYVHSYP